MAERLDICTSGDQPQVPSSALATSKKVFSLRFNPYQETRCASVNLENETHIQCRFLIHLRHARFCRDHPPRQPKPLSALATENDFHTGAKANPGADAPKEAIVSVEEEKSGSTSFASSCCLNRSFSIIFSVCASLAIHTFLENSKSWPTVLPVFAALEVPTLGCLASVPDY